MSITSSRLEVLVENDQDVGIRFIERVLLGGRVDFSSKFYCLLSKFMEALASILVSLLPESGGHLILHTCCTLLATLVLEEHTPIFATFLTLNTVVLLYEFRNS